MELKYTMVGVLGVGVTTWMAVIMPSGYRAVVTGNRLRWTWTYFGRDAVIRDYPGAVLMKYSNTNSGGMSGPEFYIEYDHRSGVRKRKRIRLRNLVNMTPDEFQPLLAAQLSPLDGVAGSDAASADADPDALGSD